MKNERIKPISEVVEKEIESGNIKTELSLKSKSKLEKIESRNNNNLVTNEKSLLNIPNQDTTYHHRKNEWENINSRRVSADEFEKYINDSGINSSFQLIFSEIIHKRIPPEDHFSYAAGRLRQIAREVESIKNKLLNK